MAACIVTGKDDTMPILTEDMKKIKAHVICNNDSIEYVFIGSEEQAGKKMEELKKAHKAQRSEQYRDEVGCPFYWHIHEVAGEIKEAKQ